MKKVIYIILFIIAIGIILFAYSLFLKNTFESIFFDLNYTYYPRQEEIIIKEEIKELNFLFLGDIMLDRSVKKLIDAKGLDYLLKNIEAENFFEGYDLISANLEGPVTNNGDHYPPVAGIDFAFSPDDVNELKRYNFNFFTIANNHLTDQGLKGVEEARANLNELGINYVGCSDAEVSECSSTILEINDYQVGMLGLSMVYHNFDLEKVISEINKLKDQTDYIITNIHWGVEYTHYFNTYQQNIAHALIDNGVDIIIGHHPHVVQGIEIYNKKPIFYSLGNFIFDQYFSSETQEGLGIGITLDNSSYNIYLFPYVTVNKYSELLKGQDREEFLANYLEWSEGEIEINNGLIHLD